MKRALLIQSHVGHGYVGNKAATFPLQYRGWDVDAINTVQFSNHPGYGNFTGFKYQGSDLGDIVEFGLLKSLEVEYDVVLMGYIPCEQSLQNLSQTIGNLCNDNQNVEWIVDPVLGDNGHLYVDEGIVNVYKKILRENRIFLTTPNQFEMELLTGVKITSLESLEFSVTKFHQLYPSVQRIVITSIELLTLEREKYFISCTEFKLNNSDREAHVIHFEVPRIDAHFCGSGDLFSALILDQLLGKKTPLSNQTNPTLADAVGKCLYLVQKILQRTYDLTECTATTSGRDTSVESRVINDLKLIQSRDILAIDTEKITNTLPYHNATLVLGNVQYGPE